MTTWITRSYKVLTIFPRGVTFCTQAPYTCSQFFNFHRITMPFRFPVEFELPKHCYLNARVIKDQFKRLQFSEHEVTRNALKYIAKNTELSPRVRLEAQLQLTSMPKYTSYSQVKNRCVASGHAKSVITDFKLNRVSTTCFCQLSYH